MSCYLNIYLVPEGKNNKEAEPVLFDSYSRNSDVYQAITDIVAVPYIATEKETFADLTPIDMQSVKEVLLDDIKKVEDKVGSLYKVLEKSYNEELKDDIVEFEAYIRELKEQLAEVEHIKFLVDAIYSDYSNFKKVVVNQG